MVNKYLDRDLLHHHIKNATTSIVPGNKNFKGIRTKEFNSKLNKCSTRFRPFIGASLKQIETYVKPILNDDTLDVLILRTGLQRYCNKQLTKN